MAFQIPPYFQEKFITKFLAINTKQWVTSTIAFVGGLAILIAYFQSGPNPIHYAKGEEAFAKWEADSENDELFLKMKEAFKNAPSLEEKYQAPIVQSLINKERVNEALKLAGSSIDALKEKAPFHASFGETTLLIEKGAFQEALEKSVSLKEEMKRELNLSKLKTHVPILGGAVLYAQNLLRIASLQKELSNGYGEKAAWDELEAFLQSDGPIRDLLYANFREKGVDLTTYIKERRKSL